MTVIHASTQKTPGQPHHSLPFFTGLGVRRDLAPTCFFVGLGIRVRVRSVVRSSSSPPGVPVKLPGRRWAYRFACGLFGGLRMVVVLTGKPSLVVPVEMVVVIAGACEKKIDGQSLSVSFVFKGAGPGDSACRGVKGRVIVAGMKTELARPVRSNLRCFVFVVFLCMKFALLFYCFLTFSEGGSSLAASA